MTPSHGNTGEREWTLYSYQDGGWQVAGEDFNPGSRTEVVKVVPSSQLDQVREERDQQKLNAEINRSHERIEYERANKLQARVEELEGLDPAATNDPERCHRCGTRSSIWSAASPLWNAVIRGGSINGEPKYDDMVCASCFMQIAEEQGIARVFRVRAEEVNVDLETTTPSGRVWDEELFMWAENAALATSPPNGEGPNQPSVPDQFSAPEQAIGDVLAEQANALALDDNDDAAPEPDHDPVGGEER